jgi:hypothetical protein
MLAIEVENDLIKYYFNDYSNITNIVSLFKAWIKKKLKNDYS